jgi:hypothetical protein
MTTMMLTSTQFANKQRSPTLLPGCTQAGTEAGVLHAAARTWLRGSGRLQHNCGQLQLLLGCLAALAMGSMLCRAGWLWGVQSMQVLVSCDKGVVLLQQAQHIFCWCLLSCCS